MPACISIGAASHIIESAKEEQRATTGGPGMSEAEAQTVVDAEVAMDPSDPDTQSVVPFGNGNFATA